MDRLTEAVARGVGALPAILDKLTREETRRADLSRESDALEVAAQTVDLYSAKLWKAIRAAAQNVQAALHEHPDGAREVLSAFASRIECTPFGKGHGGGYDFKGLGDYGALLGETPARRGVPEGIGPLGAVFVVEGRAA